MAQDLSARAEHIFWFHDPPNRPVPAGQENFEQQLLSMTIEASRSLSSALTQQAQTMRVERRIMTRRGFHLLLSVDENSPKWPDHLDQHVDGPQFYVGPSRSFGYTILHLGDGYMGRLEGVIFGDIDYPVDTLEVEIAGQRH